MMPPYKHTDLSYLREIADGNQGFIDEMIRVFSGSAPQMISEMEHCLARNDWAGIKIVAHKLKPGIAFMGIKELEQDIVAIEDHAARRQDLDQLPGLINRMRVIILLSIEELKG